MPVAVCCVRHVQLPTEHRRYAQKSLYCIAVFIFQHSALARDISEGILLVKIEWHYEYEHDVTERTRHAMRPRSSAGQACGTTREKPSHSLNMTAVKKPLHCRRRGKAHAFKHALQIDEEERNTGRQKRTNTTFPPKTVSWRCRLSKGSRRRRAINTYTRVAHGSNLNYCCIFPTHHSLIALDELAVGQLLHVNHLGKIVL